MEMENIEVARTLSDLRQHGEMSRNVPGELLVQPERYLSAWNEFCACFAITTLPHDRAEPARRLNTPQLAPYRRKVLGEPIHKEAQSARYA